MPARTSTVFEEITVARPTPTGAGASIARVRSPLGREQRVFPSETELRFQTRKSWRSIAFSIAMTVAQFSAKRAYLRGRRYRPAVARRKALWHIR